MPDADLVAAHTFDPAEYLMRRHRDPDDPFTLRDEFPGRDDGSVPDAVTYHVACHLQAQNAGLRSRDLLKVAGVKCSLVQRCSGIDGTWGYRAENYELARKVAAPAGPRDRGGRERGGVRRLPPGQRVDPPGDGDPAGAPAAADGPGLRPGGPRGAGLGVTQPTAPHRGLTLADVLDLRAYERVREDYRARVIARKRNRRVGLGPIMTLVFECVDTVRFQVQEMARVEKIISDEAIQVELDIYNRLLPGDGELSATLFIELTSDDALREWLPRLVGIERQLGVSIDGDVVASVPEAEHAAALTRETVTPAVHYLRFGFTEAQVAAFRDAEPRSPWWRPTPPTRPGPSCRPRCGRSCSGTCSAQQSPYRSADQGQFRAQVFTDARDVSHTLRSPNLGMPSSVVAPKGPPNRANASIRLCIRY